MRAILVATIFATAVVSAGSALAVTVNKGTTVNGIKVDLWTWTDSHGNPRTAALKQEGNGNSGHGGYAIQMTYVGTNASGGPQKVTVNAESGNDGGFGYFVSHERYRKFQDGEYATIAGRIFHKDDSPLGLGFAATTSSPAMPAGSGAERFTIRYGHYGTAAPDPVDPNTGDDSTPLPTSGTANFAFYTLPVSTTWVFQDGVDYPRIDVLVNLSRVIPPGGAAPTADLVSFDVRGPYGVMVFDNGADGIVKSVAWGDQAYTFAQIGSPVTRSSQWNWSHKNSGSRYQALTAGLYEMGLYEPRRASMSATVDGYAAERSYTSSTFAASGQTSASSCGGTQTLPSDGTWPYQSVQYSLPCALNTPTNGKKIAWGSTAYYGTSLTGVYDGVKSFPFNGFPASRKVAYSVCLVLGQTRNGPLTKTAAAAYAQTNPIPNCATQAAH
jgi:hypothetical protein